MSQPSMGESKQRILLLLLNEEATAEQIASKMEMNLSVVRRHLEDLVAQRLVESAFRRAGRGRPSKLYTISSEGRARVSSRYDLVAELLTAAVRKDLGAEKSGDLYRSAGEILAKSVGRFEKAESMLPVLTEFGFQPELRKAGKSRFIVSKNCPILKLAKEYPELTCDTFHTVFLRESLNRPQVSLKQAIARGAKECLHEY